LSPRQVLALTGLALLILASASGFVSAQTFTQGYDAEGALQKGMIVRLKDGNTSRVQAVSKEEMDKMHGVVVNPNDAAVTLSGGSEKVFVATRGRYEVLVSTENGNIKENDLITVSSLKGVGMKTGTVEPYVVAKAVGSFDGTSKVAGTSKLKDSMGGEKEIKFGRVEAEINVGKNPMQKAEDPNLPEFLRKASESIAGKPVDAVRVYIGLVIFFLAGIISGVLLYGGVKSGIISIGRNPLSKKQIIRGMLQVIITSLIIFILGIFAVYLILKL
jgi:hypothetical protein